MQIPDLFFGTAKAVAQRLRKVNTQLMRGARLAEILESCPRIESTNRRESLIRLAAFWATLGGEHFVMYGLGQALSTDRRLEWSDVSRIRRESIDYLASTPWGTLLINSPQQYYWITDYPLGSGDLQRDAVIALLNGTEQHSCVFEDVGASFTVGADCALPFRRCKPLASHALALCFKADGQKTGQEFAQGDVAQLCRESHVVERLANDDAYWQRVCHMART